MSRNTLSTQSKFVDITTGKDHAIGKFIQIQDRRYSQSDKDDQGEGYVLDWDEMFGFTINLINATLEDLKDTNKLVSLCDEFAKTL